MALFDLSAGAFVGKYCIVSSIGSGGMGMVYRATDPSGRYVALKILRPELADDPIVRERLRREAEALLRVRGGRTAAVIDVQPDNSPPFIVMELVEGLVLNEYISRNGPLTGLMMRSFAQGICEAVSDIHKVGVIHRDLKPSNVIFGPDGVKVIDFGVSVLIEATALTKTGVFIGTTSWLAPEQVLGNPVTEATDVFNLGLLIGYSATGVHPFGDGNPDAVMYRVVHEQPNLGGLSGSLRNFVERCLQKDPSLRPTVGQLRERLTAAPAEEFSVNQPTSATKILPGIQVPSYAPPHENKVEATSKSKQKAPFMAVAAIVAAIALIGVVVSSRDDSADSPILVSDTTLAVSDDEVTDQVVDENFGLDLADALEADFDTAFADILSGSYQLPELTNIENTVESAMSSAFGVQMDCDGFYPLRELLPFWRDTKPIFSESYSNYLADEEYPNKFIISNIRVSVFYVPGELDNFLESSEYLQDRIDGCEDEDFYLPYDERPEIQDCATPLFTKAGWTDMVIDDACARRINQTVSWDTDSFSSKEFYELKEPAHGRKRFGVSFDAIPIEDEDKVYGSYGNQSVHVWAEEGIVMVVTSFGGNSNQDFPNGEEKIIDNLFYYRFAAEDTISDIFDNLKK